MPLSPNLMSDAEAFVKDKQNALELERINRKSARIKAVIFWLLTLACLLAGAAFYYDQLEITLYAGLCFAGAVLFFILAIVNGARAKRSTQEIYEINHRKFSWRKNEMKVGLSTIKLAKYPFENKTILIDEDRLLSDINLNYRDIEDLQSIISLKDGLTEEIRTLPYIYNPQPDEMTFDSDDNYKLLQQERHLASYLDGIKDEYAKSRMTSINIGLVNKDNQVLHDLFTTRRFYDVPQSDFKTSEIYEKLDHISGIIKTQQNEEEDIDDFSVELADDIEQYISNLEDIRLSSFSAVKSEGEYLQSQMLLNSHNYYCPECNKEVMDDLLARSYTVIEGNSYEPISFVRNSLMVLTDVDAGVWQCPLCKTETRQPLPVHKMYDEVFMPSGNVLLRENENTRIKLYGDLRTRLIETEQRVEKEYEDFTRSTRRVISDEKLRIMELNGEINAKKELIEDLTDQMKEYHYLEIEESNALKKRVSGLAIELTAKNQTSIASINNDVSRLNTRVQNANKRLAEFARKDQEKRDKQLQTIAKASVQSAKANQRTANASERTAKAGERTANASERAANAGERTANASERTARFTRKTARRTKKSVKVEKKINKKLL